MSVINKMLRDLDKQQNTTQRKNRTFHPHRKNPLLIWLAIPVALLAGWLGQSWYVAELERQANPPPVVPDGPKKPLDPMALATEFVPEIAVVEKQKAALMGTTEQTVSAKDVIASKIPPQVAAKLGGQSIAAGRTDGQDEKRPADDSKLESFISQPLAQEKVVQVKALTQEQLDALEVVEPEDTADVMVDTYPQEAELMNESVAEMDAMPQAPAKPRSLAIEKVELSAEQHIALLKEKAIKAESAGQLMQATEYWHLIRQTAPDTSQPYLELARLFQVQGKDADALNVLQQATVSVAQDPKISMALAALALKQQDWEKALTYLHYEPDIFQYADFYALKAAALQKTNQHTQAIEVFQQLARQQPEQARWWLGMALSYDALQQKPQATVAYKQALVNGTTLSATSLDYVKKRIAVIE